MRAESAEIRTIKYQSIDPRAQLIILVLINIIGMTNNSPLLESVWIFVYISLLLPSTLTVYLAIIGAMGRKIVPIIMFPSSIIRILKVQGKTVIIVEQRRHYLEELMDRLMILDEPTSGLDYSNMLTVKEILK